VKEIKKITLQQEAILCVYGNLNASKYLMKPRMNFYFPISPNCQKIVTLCDKTD
jgi:hypothetical protein